MNHFTIIIINFSTFSGLSWREKRWYWSRDRLWDTEFPKCLSSQLITHELLRSGGFHWYHRGLGSSGSSTSSIYSDKFWQRELWSNPHTCFTCVRGDQQGPFDLDGDKPHSPHSHAVWSSAWTRANGTSRPQLEAMPWDASVSCWVWTCGFWLP